MRPVISPRPLAGPALLAHYGVKIISELATVPGLRIEIDAVARANNLGAVQMFFLNHVRGEAWDGETERIFIIGTRAYAEVSLPSLRVARVGTMYAFQTQLAFLPLTGQCVQGVGRTRRVRVAA